MIGSRKTSTPLKKPELGNIKMNCDRIIHKKLADFPMTNDAWSTNNFTVIVGKMGQGKTSWVTNYIKNIARKCYETIYVFMPLNSRESIDNNIYGKNLPEDQLFDTLTETDLLRVYEELQEHSSNCHHSLLIIDDFPLLFGPMLIVIGRITISVCFSKHLKLSTPYFIEFILKNILIFLNRNYCLIIKCGMCFVKINSNSF
jgi:hypothetical protein